MEKVKYNSRYRELQTEGGIPKYLERENLEKIEMGDGIRALVMLRCGNLEEWNKYWLEEKERLCGFCSRGKDNLEHFVGTCEVTKEWFNELRESYDEIMRRIWSEKLDEKKGEILVKLWKKKERRRKKGVVRGRERRERRIDGCEQERM